MKLFLLLTLFVTSLSFAGTPIQPGGGIPINSIPVKMGAKGIIGHVRLDYTLTNVTTAAYVQLVAAMVSPTTEIEIFDSSGQTLVLATGAAGFEVDKIYVFPGGNGRVPLALLGSDRVSIKAVSATANVGELDINFYD